MNLRAQLALVCLSLLILPWAVFLFVGELDRNLREVQLKQSQENAIAAANTAEAVLAGNSTRVRPESKTLLAGVLTNDLLIDGYADDWSAFELGSREFDYAMNKVTVDPEDLSVTGKFLVTAAVRQRYLYLFIRVQDQSIVYHQPSSLPAGNLQGIELATGDRLIIRVPDDNGKIRRYTYRWEAPGAEVGRYLGDANEGVRPIRIGAEYRAALAESVGGYNIELRLPLPADLRFGLTVIDVDGEDNVQRWTGMFNPNEPDDVGHLQVIDGELSEGLSEYIDPGMRMRVFSGQGWLLADADERLPDASVRDFEPAEKSIFDAVLHRFIAWSLAKNVDTRALPEIADGKLDAFEIELLTEVAEKPEFLIDKYQRIFHTSAVTLEQGDDLLGYLLVQQPRASLTSFTETAMVRLVKIFGLAVVLIALALIGFASLLSWRVRRLRDDVERTVSGDGVIVRGMDKSSAPDEIGDLSRSFHTIISRLDGYTHYLQSLGSRLSHELRTPLSVVSTSLEAIDRSKVDSKTGESLQRAELGAARLQRLIRNLSEASSVEQTIERSEKTVINLKDWIAVAAEVYDDLYQHRDVVLRIDSQLKDASVDASVELLHQMLDKLMANAVDFSANGSEIILSLSGQNGTILIGVENTGSQLLLPSSELFEPMVSLRDTRDDQPHMGFGLHIVKLIADFHGAECFARNLPGKDAVRFSVKFPLSGEY